MDGATSARRSWRILSLFFLILLLATIVAARVAFAGLPSGQGMPAGEAAPVVRPASTVTWLPASSFNEPDSDNIAPAVNPTDPLRALLGGPGPRIRYTTDGGATWPSPTATVLVAGGVPAWVPGGNGQSAVYVSLSQGTAQPQANLTPGPTGNSLNFVRSTNGGVNWSAPVTLTIPGIAENQPFLWADANPSSPYYGRMYLTLTVLDSARTGSFDTVGVLRSTDQGVSWSAPVGLVNPNEFMQGSNYNAFASAAIQPSGAVVVAWHRGTCCGTITNVSNKVMWSRSTDGGATFPISGTIATVPISQSLEYNSMGPANFRWTPAPNIAADPVDGTLYAAWVAYGQPNVSTSAAVYVSRSTNNGASWSTPAQAGNGPYQYWYLPWLQVSPDHVVHLTFQGALLTDLAAHFYTQSTDGGATWSTPFQLSGAGYSYFGQGDYQATSVGGYNGSQGAILTSWQIMIGSGVRMGTFPLPAATPSPTPTCAPGVAWGIRPERYQGELDGVAAISSNDVWAVGSGQSQHWDGSQWSIVPSPSGLYAVSAVSSNDVWAVGGTVVVHWDGSHWSIVPLPPNADPLYGVAAVSSNDVWAVGSGQALHWNGTSWNFVPGSSGPLYAVTAISANDVWAVGGGPSQALIEHWNGSTWSVVPNPGTSTLRGVAGVSANDVWAVGGRLTLHWDGSQWSVVPSPANYTLFAVAAISSNNVWAVGYCTTGCGEVYHVGTLHWDGSTWNQVTVHDRNQGAWSILYGVAAISANDVWAVGYDTSGTGAYTLIEHYPAPPCGVTTTPTRTPTASPTCAAGWTIYPNPAPPGSVLNGIAALSSNDLWAVGSYTTTGTMHTLTLHGNGSSWSIVPSADPPSGDAALRGVAGVSSNDLWAVGYAGTQALTEHWNGSSWSIVASPYAGILNAVTAIASNDVWAVGQQGGATLLLHWDGSSWSPVACSPCYALYGVSSVASNDVWTVGAYLGAPIPTTAHWDGSGWTYDGIADKGIFRSVEATASNDVWAVGCFFGNCTNGSTATFHWNGTQWSSVANPNVSGGLYGVSKVAANEAWAVGGYSGGGTLTMHCVLSGCTIVASPGTGSLNGVASVGANDVWAVGNNGNNALILHYTAACATATVTPPAATATATCSAGGTPGPWTSRANYALFAGGVGVASDGTSVYAFCGRQGGSGYGGGYKYDYATDTWTSIASPGGTGCSEAGTEYGHNGKIYLIGGTTTTGLNRIYDIASNTFTQGAPMAGPRDYPGHAYWNGKIYMIGGLYGGTIYDTVYAYDIASDTWSTLAPLPQAEYGMASAAINGKIYVANGNIAGGGQTNNLYIYDIATDTWSAGSPSPVASVYAGSTVIGGKLYMIAGGTVTYLYDPATDSWSQGPSLSVGRADGNAATINTPGGQTAIVVGGLHSNGWTNSVEASTLPLVPCATPTVAGSATASATATATTCVSGGIWGELAPYPIAIAGNAVTSLGNNIYSFGGIVNNTAVANAYTYSPHSWATIAPLPGPRNYASAVSDGTYVYILGGWDQNANPTSTIWRYDPATNTYNTSLAAYTIPTYGQAAAYVNGKIYRIAGRAIGTDYHVEVYNIATNTWSMAANYPFANHSLMAVALDGYIYAGGGNASPDKTWRYDPNTDIWDDAAIADLPAGRSAAASGVYNGRWLLAGGDVNFAISDSVISWDPATNSWTNLANMVHARDYLGGATSGAFNFFQAVGGDSAPGTSSNDNQVYFEGPCMTPSPTLTVVPSNTSTNTRTPTRTNTPTATKTPTGTMPTAVRTNTPGGPTDTPISTFTACPIHFTDVPPGSTFYPYIRCLACRGIVSGYSDGTFRPDNNVTRGQLSKIVSNAAGFSDPQTTQMFEDVPPGSTFFDYIGRLASRGYIQGYSCGGPGEPCNPPANLPYFRWQNNATRGQITKIVSNAAGFNDPPVGQIFEDVPPGSTFYTYTQRLASRGVMQGYQCGGAGEPCIPPGNRPYFRPFYNATRGQTAKIVANTFFPDCDTPIRK